jgi:tRNA G18 (ribose-2'-O)-methylase SpoU
MEITENSMPLTDNILKNQNDMPIALILGNEKTGVLQETLDACDLVVHIPMQ